MCADTPACQDSYRDCSNRRSFARRGGIAKRGEGSPSTTSSYHEKEVGPWYFQAKPSHRDNAEIDIDIGIDIDAYPPSPPLSPKTTVTPLIVRRTRRVDRKRDHPYQQPPSNRRPSWRPNLKQELSRRDSIDSIIAPFNEVGWFETDCQVSGVGRRCSTDSVSNCGDVDMQKPRQRSTLLHPSTPDVESAAGLDPFDALSTHPLVMASRKGSSLLHPSRPASDVPSSTELKTVMSIPPKFVL